MIRGAIKFLVKDTAIYGIAGAVSKFIAVFTVPIIVRILTKEEYGILTTVISTSSVFIGVITLGMDSSIARWFFEQDNDFEYRKKIVSTGFFIQLAALVLFMPIILLTSDYVGGILFDGNEDIVELWKLYLLSVPAFAFVLFSQNLFKWNFERNNYLILSLGMSTATVGLTLYFLIVLKMGLYGAIIAPIIASVAFSFFGVIVNRKYISIKSIGSKQLILDMLKYGWPFAIIIILGAAIPSIDRLFLIRLVDLTVIGEYAVAVKIANLLLIIVGAFQISFGPYAYSIWKKEEAPKVFAQLAEYYFSGMLFIGILMSMFADIGIKVFAGEQYYSSKYLLPMLTVAIGIQGMSQFTLLGITWAKKTMFNLIGSVFMFTCLLGFNYLLTPMLFQSGAATAILLTQLFYILFTLYISQKYYYLPIKQYRFLIVLVLTGVGHWSLMQDFIIVIKILIGVIYILGLITIWGWWPKVLKLIKY